MSGKNLLSIADLNAEDVGNLIRRAAELKRRDEETCLKGKVLALLFEKPSLRTRVSFEVAMLQMGGHAIYLSPNEVGLGKREQIPDVARTLSRYVDIIASRTFSQQTLELMAHYAEVPVINALSDREHPCQALADLLTISEKKNRLKGLQLTYVGDGNNVARSLVFAASLAGVNCAVASPTDYSLDDETLHQARGFALNNEAEIFITSNPQEAVKNADIIYTDVWTSMGQEAEADARRNIFAPYQVNSSLLSMAREDAIFMHPLPAHHGEEIADGLLEHPRSIVFDQAENRLHIQKAILAVILGE
ncbi:ornithine carbamoyltransferase [Chloroflexota bacterium]